MNLTFIQKIRNKIKIKGNNNSITLKNNKDCKFSNNKIIIKGNNTIILSEKINIRKTFFEIIGDNCTIEIGENTIIGHDSYLSAKENGTKLIIGDNCMISRNAKIMTSDGHPIFNTNNEIINKAKNITIKNHVWIADNVTILKGITVEDNCVIGINSTLTKSISSNTIAAGNPAKIIKENIKWEC